jgi:hypothetical protein
MTNNQQRSYLGEGPLGDRQADWSRPRLRVARSAARSAPYGLNRFSERSAELTNAEKHCIEDAATGLRHPRTAKEQRTFVAYARAILDRLLRADHPVRAGLRALYSEKIDRLWLHNMPLGCCGGLPQNGQRPSGKDAVSERAILGTAGMLFEPHGYFQEKGGALVQNVSVIAGQERSQSNAGTIAFRPHTDNAQIPRQFRQQFISLLGLVNEASVPTTLWQIDEVCAHLPRATVDRLHQPSVRIGLPTSFDIGGWSVRSDARAPLRTVNGRLEVAFNVFSCEALDGFEEDVAMLKAAIAMTEPLQLAIQPGSMLIWSDRRFVHGRAHVTAPRWLQRVYWRRTLTALRKTCNAPDAYVFDVRSLLFTPEA